MKKKKNYTLKRDKIQKYPRFGKSLLPLLWVQVAVNHIYFQQPTESHCKDVSVGCPKTSLENTSLHYFVSQTQMIQIHFTWNYLF